MVRSVDEGESESAAHEDQQPFSSFRCPLSNKVMTDPVAILCGHSFERSAIQEYFGKGDNNKCPNCGCELEAMDLTPNLLLRSSIDEWKHRDLDSRFQAAVLGIKSGDHSTQNKALEEMPHFMQMPKYSLRLAEQGLTSSFVEILKDTRFHAATALKCLFYLAKYDDHQKEAIVEAGAIRRIVKHLCKSGQESDALSVLLELSKKEILIDKIGNAKDCIPILVSLVENNNLEVSEKAQAVLCNISSNTHFVVKMAEAGHFQPFVARFNQGPQETRAWMAAALTQMPLKENNIKDLKDKEFIHNLIQMLSSSIPACKSACLKSIQKLLSYHKMVKRLLKDSVTIPYLLVLISYAGSDLSLKQEAAEILALLVGASKDRELQKYQGLQELQSEHNVSLLLQHVASADGQTKIQFLHLLVELSYKSETARNLIRTDEDAIARLFSSIRGEQPAVRRWAMKLINCISEGHPDGVPLPPNSPEKETAIITLAAIFTNSSDIGERSSAARIISQLPNNDAIIDEILRKSEVLKSIHEVICSMDGENGGGIATSAAARPDACLLENALAALLRYTEPTNPKLKRQLGKLEMYPSLVCILSRGSSLAKQHTAMALAQLSQSTRLLVSNGTTMTSQSRKSVTPLLYVMKFFRNSGGCCCLAPSANTSLCSIHGSACAERDTFCLVKVDAVKPLVQTLSEVESGVAEAALMALETLLIDHATLSRSISTIVDSEGVVAFLQVLEKGSSAAKSKALDLFQKILQHTHMSEQTFQRSERILIQLLHDTELKKKAALVLRQMGVIPEQSSYF